MVEPEPKSDRLPRVAIFPKEVVLSPGESTRVSIIALEGSIQGLNDANVEWSVNPPEVGGMSQFVVVTANDFPGIYPGAIRGVVTLDTESGPLTEEVNATLVIRDILDTVEVSPTVATMAKGQRLAFRAVAYDKNGVVLSDVSFRWSVTDGSAGWGMCTWRSREITVCRCLTPTATSSANGAHRATATASFSALMG